MGTILLFTGKTVRPLTALGADWETTARLPHAAADNMKPKITAHKGTCRVHGVHTGAHARGLDHKHLFATLQGAYSFH